MKFSRILEGLQILFLKFSSLLIMSLIFLFLWVQMGVQGIGEFATYATILAPIVMFSQFRYIEYINIVNIKEDKEKRFLQSLFASGMVVLLLLGILFIFYLMTHQPIKILVVAGLYKVFELFSDIYISFLVSIKELRNAFFVIFKRLFLILSGLIFFYFKQFSLNPIEFVFYLLLGVYFTFFVIDVVIEKRRFNEGPDIKNITDYIKDNFLYGFNSLLISINSLVPRYFFIFFNDKKGLGIFTIVYLLASTTTTLMQFLISVKVSLIEKFIDTRFNQYLLINLIIVGLCFGFYIFINELSDNYFLFGLSFVVMLISLLLRGVNLTASFSKKMKNVINIALILPMILVSLLLVFLCFYYREFAFKFSILYVFTSALMTSMILMFSLRKSKLIC